VEDPRSFRGRYVNLDLLKETFDEYGQSPETRNRYNVPGPQRGSHARAGTIPPRRPRQL
jgi:hypothetical protein